MTMTRRWILIGALLFSLGAHATTIEVYQFDSPQQEQTYKELTSELRCLVCQNQDIADSNAELAQDMRHKVLKMLKDGKDKQQVIDFMVQRYGDFVLYKPPLEGRTLILWIGPFVLFVLGVWLMLRAIRRARERDRNIAIDSNQIERAHHLLDNESDNGNKA
jgi:cytochrome c-type biogenesis protein CcmH